MSPLSSKRRSLLRAEAHRLTPVVLIGDKGLTDEVVAEIDRSLRAHELIKVRAATASRENRDIWLESICARLQAHPVQQIGKVFVVYRENPKEKSGPGPPANQRAGAGARGDERATGARGDGGKLRREASATTKARIVSEAAREKQRRRDEKKRREREEADLKRSGRPRSRTPSPPRESAPPRRRPRTSR